MRRLVTIFLLAYYGFGTVLFPMGDLSYIKELPQMYNHCATEDADIDICDFVFEHLLNIHDEDDAEQEHDKPHQAIYGHAPFQLVATHQQPGRSFAPAPYILWYSKATFPLIPCDAFRAGHLSDVFRPPAIIS